MGLKPTVSWELQILWLDIKILEHFSILYIDDWPLAMLFMKLVMRLPKDYTYTCISSNLSRSQMLCFEIHFNCFQEKWTRLILFMYFILVYEVLWNNHKVFPPSFTQLEWKHNVCSYKRRKLLYTYSYMSILWWSKD